MQRACVIIRTDLQMNWSSEPSKYPLTSTQRDYKDCSLELHWSFEIVMGMKKHVCRADIIFNVFFIFCICTLRSDKQFIVYIRRKNSWIG